MGTNSSKEKSDKKQKSKKKTSVPAGKTTTQQTYTENNSQNLSRTIQTQYIATTTVVESSSTDSQVIRREEFKFPSASQFPNHTISASSNIPRKFSVPALVQPTSYTISKFTTPIRPQLPPTFRARDARGPLARSLSIVPQTDLVYPQPPQRQRLPTVPIPQGQRYESAVIPIRIKKCTAVFDPKTTHVPTYTTHGRKRGLSLIINNIDFHKPRNGADNDGKNMYNLLNGLKLNPKTMNNMKSKEMLSALEKFAKNPELANVDVCVVVIMSHGSGSMDTMTEISGVDGDSIKVYDIISNFSKDRCKMLRDKPKVFIFQCCRGDQVLETDAIGIKPMHCDDMLLCYSTMPGFVSYRNPELGSYYVREICKVFSEHACDTHVEDMLRIVQENLRQSSVNQLATFENMSFKSCYLNPI